MTLSDFGEQMLRAVECWELVKEKIQAARAGDWQETSWELPL